VLANEEILGNGLSERGGFPVVRMPLRQWVLKIPQYADKLTEHLYLPASADALTRGVGNSDKSGGSDISRDSSAGGSTGGGGLHWPEGTLSAQKQWIGRSEGAEIVFAPIHCSGSVATDSASGSSKDIDNSINVFTTRPDTLMGVTYVVLAPEHPLVARLTSPAQRAAVEAYVQKVAGKSDMERTSIGQDRGKTGVFLGTYAAHPLTGEAVPVWTADYVLSTYGTGAVMAVPAHDERDFEFAQLFGLQIKTVVVAAAGTDAADAKVPAGAQGASKDVLFTGSGVVVNSGALFDGKSSEQCAGLVVQELEQRGLGRKQVSYKLRDWVFSRQRYWGEPIPIYFPVEMEDQQAEARGASPAQGAAHRILYDQPIAVADADLPLKLPDMTDFHPGDDPQGCLARAKDWRYFKQDGKWFARETNTMPQVNASPSATVHSFCSVRLIFLCFLFASRSGQAAVGTTCDLPTPKTPLLYLAKKALPGCL
jgi:leucyl-tRNA synthetase